MHITFSRIFEIEQSSDTGLNPDGSSIFLPLYRGLTLAILYKSGKIALSIDRFVKYAIGLAKYLAPSFMKSVPTSSYPDALKLFNF